MWLLSGGATRWLALAAAAAVAGSAGWYARGVVADRDESRLIANYNSQIAEQAQEAQQAEADARTEERRTAHAHQEIQDAEILKARAQAAAARRAAADAERVHRTAQAYASGSGDPAEDSSAADICAPARARALVLANLYGEAERDAQQQAAEATERGRAGDACVRAYQALTATTD